MRTLPLLFALSVILFAGCSSKPDSDPTSEIREKIYMRYFQETRASGRFVYFVTESDAFIATLKQVSSLPFITHSSEARYDSERDETVHVKTAQAGIKMKISDIVVHEATASAKFYYDATSIAAGGYTVQLVRKDGVWVVSVWRQDWVS